MRDFGRQADAALACYFKRGVKARDLLAADAVDEALAVLRQRTAAFHNFRVADALLTQAGQAYRPDAQGFVEEIARLDAELEGLLAKQAAEASQQMDRLRRQQSRIAKFRSSKSLETSFEKPI